jgi:hypothetical protein
MTNTGAVEFAKAELDYNNASQMAEQTRAVSRAPKRDGWVIPSWRNLRTNIYDLYTPP